MHGGHDLIFYKQIPYPPLSAQIKSSLFTLHRIRYLTSIFSIWMKWFASLHHCDLWQITAPTQHTLYSLQNHLLIARRKKKQLVLSNDTAELVTKAMTIRTKSDLLSHLWTCIISIRKRTGKTWHDLEDPGSKGPPIPQFTIIWDLSIYLI